MTKGRLQSVPWKQAICQIGQRLAFEFQNFTHARHAIHDGDGDLERFQDFYSRDSFVDFFVSNANVRMKNVNKFSISFFGFFYLNKIPRRTETVEMFFNFLSYLLMSGATI